MFILQRMLAGFALFSLRLKNTMTKVECDALQANIFGTVLNTVPNRVGWFGNSLSSNLTDWISVINQLPSTVSVCCLQI